MLTAAPAAQLNRAEFTTGLHTATPPSHSADTRWCRAYDLRVDSARYQRSQRVSFTASVPAQQNICGNESREGIGLAARGL